MTDFNKYCIMTYCTVERKKVLSKKVFSIGLPSNNKLLVLRSLSEEFSGILLEFGLRNVVSLQNIYNISTLKL